MVEALGEMESRLVYIHESGDRYPQCLPTYSGEA